MTFSERISDIRIQAILDAYTRGSRTNDQLEAAAVAAERQFSRRRGRSTEARFLRYIGVIHIVTNVRPSTDSEEGNGIDFWLDIEDGFKLPEIPVQIKSSDQAVIKFKKGEKYLNFGKVIIVLNVGPRISRTDFRKEFAEEFRRVRNLIRQNQST